MFVALAKHLGCDVTVAGRQKVRLQAAEKLGAGKVVDVGNGRGVVTNIREATKKQFHVVIEAVGKPETWEAAVQLVRKGGTVNFFGGCPAGATVTLDTTLIHYSNLTLAGKLSSCPAHHPPRAGVH